MEIHGKTETDEQREKVLLAQWLANEIQKEADLMEADDKELKKEVKKMKSAAQEILKTTFQMTKRIDQIRYDQLLRMEEELNKRLNEEGRREADLRKRTNELNLWDFFRFFRFKGFISRSETCSPAKGTKFNIQILRG